VMQVVPAPWSCWRGPVSPSADPLQLPCVPLEPQTWASGLFQKADPTLWNQWPGLTCETFHTGRVQWNGEKQRLSGPRELLDFIREPLQSRSRYPSLLRQVSKSLAERCEIRILKVLRLVGRQDLKREVLVQRADQLAISQNRTWLSSECSIQVGVGVLTARWTAPANLR
jgi:hypothetical protein